MSFTPHTDATIQSMLETIGVKRVEDLFDEIPSSLVNTQLNAVPQPLNERETQQWMTKLSQQDTPLTCFAGMGAYEHFIPSAVWDIVSRGEFMTAYTPYQAEASQGSLQLMYEYQTMMAELMGMEVSNASLYDGASALAEAVLMALRLKSPDAGYQVCLPATLNARYIDVVQTICENQGITCEIIAYDKQTGCTDIKALEKALNAKPGCVVIPAPNQFGMLEDVDTLTDLAHSHGARVIGLVNPLMMTVMKPPGQWGKSGCDIACGEGQPLGIPLSNGGPYFGFMTCQKASIRQMPGRIVARTVDSKGAEGFTLTLQAREQHIRRAKATSNICTNQGLMVTAATIYMTMMGSAGMRDCVLQSLANVETFKAALKKLHIQPSFSGHHGYECAFELPISAQSVIDKMAQAGILAGATVPDRPNTLVVATTEMRTDTDIQAYVQSLSHILQVEAKPSQGALHAADI